MWPKPCNTDARCLSNESTDELADLLNGRQDVAAQHALGSRFAWLWAAYAVSTFGTWFAFDAFSLIAVIVLHATPAAVSALAAAGMAAGAVAAIPLGSWIEYRRKRPVMIAMDLVRFGALMTVPVAFALGRLSFAQLLAVSVVTAAADITFTAASGAYLKSLVRRDQLLAANGRFESTTWTATMLGPPIGGFAIGLLGPATTVAANAISYLLSAVGIRAIGDMETPPVHAKARKPGLADLLEGWRAILAHPTLRLLFFNNILVSGLIMGTAPLMAALMLGQLGFAPWQYGLAFAAPCVGGLIGSRLAQSLAARFGQRRIILVAGTLRACWSIGLAFVHPGTSGLVLVILVQFGLVTCMGLFNPILASARLEQCAPDRVARVLSAWSVTSKATIALTTAVWGLLAGFTGARAAIAIAGVLMLGTPFLLPRRDHADA